MQFQWMVPKLLFNHNITGLSSQNTKKNTFKMVDLYIVEQTVVVIEPVSCWFRYEKNSYEQGLWKILIEKTGKVHLFYGLVRPEHHNFS